MSFRAYLLVLLVLVAAPHGLAAPGDWPGVYVINGIDENLPYTDLEPLKWIVGNSQVIGLGETIHTSGGYYQGKFRVIKFLVEEMGVRAVAFETPWANAMTATEYVRSGQGTVTEALNSIFSVWGDIATRDLLAWLRSYNQQHKEDKVVFFGFDAQQPVHDFLSLRDFLTDASPDDPSYLVGISQCIGNGFQSDAQFFASGIKRRSVTGRFPMTEAQYFSCLQGLRRIRSFFHQNQNRLLERTSSVRLTWAWTALEGVESSQHQYNAERSIEFTSRDLTMANNFSRIRNLLAPNKKTVIWAHNTHLARGVELMPAVFRPGKNMGTFLSESLGASYFPIGLIGYDVQIDWPGAPVNAPRIPREQGTLPLFLHQQGCKYVLLDASRSFLNSERVRVGSDQEPYVRAGDHYGALLYFDHSRARIPVTGDAKR